MKKETNNKRTLWIAGGILIAAAIGLLVYLLLSRGSSLVKTNPKEFRKAVTVDHLAVDPEEHAIFIDNMLLAFLWEPMDEAEADALAASVDGEVVGRLCGSTNTLQIEVAPASYAELREKSAVLMQNENVLFAQQDLPFSVVPQGVPAGSESEEGDWNFERDVWWVQAIGADTAWKYSSLAGEITVGVIDSGIQVDHPALTKHGRQRIRFLDAFPLNSVDSEHGTAVTALAAAGNDDGKMRGVADTANIIFTDYTPPGEKIVFDSFALMEASEKMVDSGAKVINCSIGDARDSRFFWGLPLAKDKNKVIENSLREQFEAYGEDGALCCLSHIVQLMASEAHEDHDFLLVQAAGNGFRKTKLEKWTFYLWDQDDDWGIGYDAIYDGLFCSVTQELFEKFENRLSEQQQAKLKEYQISFPAVKDHLMIVAAVDDETKEGQYCLTKYSNYGSSVDIAAPGENIYTAGVSDYGLMGGTSASAPLVSGSAALLWSIDPELSAAEVKDLLIENAGSAIGVWDEDKGRCYPMLNVGRAVEKLLGKASAPLEAEELEWALEPVFDYADVTVIQPDTVSGSGFGWQLRDDRNLIPGEKEMVPGVFDLSSEAYSWAPGYYAVQSGGSWFPFSMSELWDSAELGGFADHLSGTDTGIPRLEAEGSEIGICLSHASDGQPLSAEPPWNLLFRSAQSTTPGYYLELLWSETKGRSYLVNYSEDQWFFSGGEANPVRENMLSKPWPALSIDSPERSFMKRLEDSLPEDGAFSFAFSGSPADYDGIAYERRNEQGDVIGVMVQGAGQERRYGYVNESGVPITEFVYSDAQLYSEGIAACSRDHAWDTRGTYCYLDETGTPINDETYDSCFPCTCDTIVAEQNGQVGLLYRDGTVLIRFGAFEDLAPAYLDLLWAKQDGKWGLLDLAKAKAALGLPLMDDIAAERQRILTNAPTALDTQQRSAEKDLLLYRTVLEDIRANPSVYHEMAAGERIEENEFSLMDLDQDGRPELLVRFSNGTVAAAHLSIWAIRANQAGVDQAMEIGRVSPSGEFYSGGYIKDNASHNHSYGETVWPYSVYRISEMTSARDPGNWERRIADAYSEDAVLYGYPGPGYDASKDADGDGVIYYFNETDTPVPLTKAEYDAKVNERIPAENLLLLIWNPLTAEKVNGLTN